MTDHTPTDDGSNGDDRPNGVIQAILDLLAEMDERGDRVGRGRWADDRFSVDYSVSIGGLDEAFGPGGRGPRDPPDSGSRKAPDAGGDPAITVREFGDEMLIVADLPNVRAEAVDVERDEQTVVITAEGDVLGRVPIDDEGWEVVDVSFNNDVMEARLTRE